MNTTQRELQERQLRRFEEDLSARLGTLFERCPTLCGFTVQEGGAAPAQLTCFPPPDQEQAEALMEEVMRMLAQLVDERPEGAPLLHGRTFARAVH